MGIKHANRVQAALDRALELRPDLAEFFSLLRNSSGWEKLKAQAGGFLR